KRNRAERRLTGSLSGDSRPEDLGGRQYQKRTGGQCHAIGNAGMFVMQAQQPGLPRQQCRQWALAEQQNREGQGAAADAGNERINHHVRETQPQRHGGKQLGVTAADPAQRKEREADHQSQQSRQHVPAGRAERKPDYARKHGKGSEKRQIEEIGDGETGEVENRGSHQKKRQSDENKQLGEQKRLLKDKGGRLAETAALYAC